MDMILSTLKLNSIFSTKHKLPGFHKARKQCWFPLTFWFFLQQKTCRVHWTVPLGTLMNSSVQRNYHIFQSMTSHHMFDFKDLSAIITWIQVKNIFRFELNNDYEEYWLHLGLTYSTCYIHIKFLIKYW